MLNLIKHSYKRIICLGVTVVMALNIGVVQVDAGDYTDNLVIKYNEGIYKYQERLITIDIDGVQLQTGDMPAVLINNTTMVPVREVFESDAINAVVNWNGTTNQVFISYEDKFIVLKIDSKIAYINNEPFELSVPAMLIQDMSKTYPKTMIPLRFVSEALGFDVQWLGESFTAAIDTRKNIASTPDDSDITKDNSIVSGEQLDRLEGTKANRPLPTALLSNPVVFSASGDIDEEIDADYFDVEIKAMDLDTVMIDDIDYVESDGKIGFSIEATDKISNVDTFVWNGKFIIEIYNSSLNLNSNTIDYNNNPIVTAIRSGEHVNDEGVAYSKIVFDLKTSGYKFNVKLSDDRTKLEVEAVNNSIYKIKLGQNTTGDYIDITGVNATVVEVFRLSNPTRIVFDMPNTKTMLGYNESVANGQYVTAIRTAQFEATTARIVVETDGQPDYQVIESSEGVTRIQILEPTYENITYDHTEDIPTIVIDKDDTLTIDNIKYEDNYLNREYIITIPGDFTSHFGSGNVQINDAIIDNISVKLDNEGNTKLVVKAKTIREFRVEETNKGLAIKVYKPSELFSKVIVVDAGHGGDDPGAIIGSFYEKDTTLGVTQELEKLLDQDPTIKVYYTRLTDSRPSLYERTDLANEVEADFFLSIHINSFTSNFNGVETLFLPGPNTSKLNSFELAAIFQEVFSANVEIANYKAKERDNLHVLNATDMPAIILEMGYLSNEYDRAYLTNLDYYDDLARAILMAINETFSKHPTGR